MGSSINFDAEKIDKFLKLNQSGPLVEDALRIRTMIHWIDPKIDRQGARMLPVYTELLGHIEWPFSILDVGCMCGWLKHFLLRHFETPIHYVGIDKWPEALKVAKEFDPLIDVSLKDILEDEIPGPYGEGFTDQYRYTWCSNINFGKNAPKVIEKMMAHTEETAFFGMPEHCGNYDLMAKDLGYKTEIIYCGEAFKSRQFLVKVCR